jgi:hypothetical protein
MVEEAEGPTIQPLISTRKTEVPPGDAAAMKTPPKWDDTIDAHLRRLAGEYGPKWKLISKSLGEFTDRECKHRWMFLSNHDRLR